MAEAVNEGLMAGVDDGEKLVVGLSVADVEIAMQRFGWIDYIVFILMLVICAGIGLYFAFVQKSSSVQDYLVGGRSMKVFPIAMSLVASFISGISLLGIPTEIYVYGIQYVYIIGGVILSAVAMDNIYLPVFHNLKLTSTYEYLERRFDKRIRLFGSILFTVGIVTWLPIVVYVPALAFNQVTGINVHLITPTVCIICIFYTTVGGLKAVVWTDVFQTVVMIGVMILIAIKGTYNVGGIGVVWRRNWESDRIEWPNLELDLLSRHTMWSLVIGGFIYLLQSASVNQNMIQRYLSIQSLNSSRKALWLFVLGMSVIILVCSYSGMLIYATYHKCDPLITKLAKEKDQLLPLLVMEVLGDIPGLSGLFIAGIFSAALSSLSTGLNSMAAVVLEDFYKTFFAAPLSRKQTYILMKTTVIVIGSLCVALVFVVEKLGAVLQLTMSIGAISSGPCLALFTMGMLLPWINTKGALIGGSFGLMFMSWLCLRTQAAIASGDILFPEKPVTTEGCHYHFTPKAYPAHEIVLNTSINGTDVSHPDEIFMLYRLSYLWYTLIGALTTIFVALIVSFSSKPNDPKDVDPLLLAPFVRKLIKPRRYSNQPNFDEIIYAYKSHPVPNHSDLKSNENSLPESVS